MEVILLEKIRRLGSLGAKVNVSAGFGRNYLIPQGKAVPANEANLAEFEVRRAELEQAAQARLTAAEQRRDQLAALSVTIAAKAGDEGKLFGSIGTRDLAEAITAAGVPVVKSEVRLPDGLIRQAGQYEIALQLHTDVMTQVNVAVVAEQ